MGIGALNYQGVKGGIKLNDVIEEFKYAYKGQEIKVGDFVNYINGVAGQNTETSVDTQLSSMGNSGYTISAVQLDNSRVFIAHSYDSDYKLYGMVVTINGVSITAGTDTQISSTAYANNNISTQLLPNGSIFIAHCTVGSSYYLQCSLCSVNGTTITYLDGRQLSTYKKSGVIISTQLLSNGNIFVAHGHNTDYYLYGIVVTINETTIGMGSDTSLDGVKRTGTRISTELLPNGNIFIAYNQDTYIGTSYSTNAYLYGTVVTINGISITKGTNTQLSATKQTGSFISTELLPNGNIFIAHSYDSDYKLYGMVVTINGVSITAGTDTQISSTATKGAAVSTQLLSNGNVFIAHRYTYSQNYYLYAVIVTINGTTVTVGTDTQLNAETYSGGKISSLLLQNGTIFTAYNYSSNYLLYSQIFGIDEENNVPTNQIKIPTYEQQVTLATEPPFDAIALSNGTGGTSTAHNQQVKIAKPNI